MARVRSLPVLIVLIVNLGALAAAQVVIVPPTRDGGVPPPPIERRVPVGTATLSGTVVNADGRPIRNARVTISGQVPQNMSARGTGAGPTQIGFTTPTVTVIEAGRGGASIPPGITRGGSPSSLTRTVLTDDQGQFSFPRLPAGQFTVSVSHSQYLQRNYGQRRPGAPGAYIALADGQERALTISMARGGVISGRAIGPDREPMPNVQVRALRYALVSGFKRLQTSGFATTDDRGMYRMHSLQPGDYIVAATPNSADASRDVTMLQYEPIERAIVSGQAIPPAAPGMTPTVAFMTPAIPPGSATPTAGFLPTYAPAASRPFEATRVTVSGDDENTGVDVFVRHVQASVIQGTVQLPPDPAVSVQVALLAEDVTTEPTESGAIATRADATGRFTFRTVRPGRYTVLAVTVPAPQVFVQGQPPVPPPALSDAQKLWGSSRVTVEGEPSVSVHVTLREGRSISGIVLFEMQRPPDLTRTRLSVVLQPAPSAQTISIGPMPQAQVGPDGRFTLTGVPPGRYILRTNGGGSLKSAIVGAQDTLDYPLEFTGENDVAGAVLTITDRLAEVHGTLTDNAGDPASGYTIVVAATDDRFWTPGSRRLLVTRPGPDGRYSLRGLPAGSYFLTVVTDIEQGAQYDPEFLRALVPQSVNVMVLEGARVQQDLRVK